MVVAGAEAIWTPFLGRKFTWALNDCFREEYRHAVAHLKVGSDDLDTDSLRDLDRCRNASIILRYMARMMIETELRLAEGK